MIYTQQVFQGCQLQNTSKLIPKQPGHQREAAPTFPWCRNHAGYAAASRGRSLWIASCHILAMQPQCANYADTKFNLPIFLAFSCCCKRYPCANLLFRSIISLSWMIIALIRDTSFGGKVMSQLTYSVDSSLLVRDVTATAVMPTPSRYCWLRSVCSQGGCATAKS